ncbi:MAG: peptide-methionine (S)-S-oxide reductase MsrA [Methylococcales bacterium]|nr:peptide-methionine (S)-S-oxide reductase MsrA [Methylococcales bacterium]
MKSSKHIKPSPSNALPGRQTVMPISQNHFVTKNTLKPPFPDHLQQIIFGLGCFWGVERKFWQQTGVFSTAVGYIAGYTPNPTYDELCSGLTGHNEVVKVIFDPDLISYQQLLVIFWQSHNPTQGMRQGNDQGTQYRSGIYTSNDEQLTLALKSKQHYQEKLSALGFAEITTEIFKAPEFYYAEEYHQQYLAKNPQGYCGLGGLDIPFN